MSSSARPLSLLVALAACGLSTAGCGGGPGTTTGRPPRVVAVASTDVWGDIAATVGGPDVQVTSFIDSSGQDPHSFTPSARDELAVSKADVVIENGGGYDDFMHQLLDAGHGDPTVLDAVEISGLGHPSSAAANEHVWYDLPTAVKVASRMASAFAAADPSHRAVYRRNATRFDSAVDTLIKREATMKRRFEGTRIAVTEPVPLYMTEAIGAVNETPEQFSAAVEGGGDVSVSGLDQMLTLLKDHTVAALVYNDQTSGALTGQVESAAEDAGVPVVAVAETLPDHAHYVSWMAGNLDHLDTALSTP
jgi:zinc/manganese transport system substrate-binding protein